MSTPATATVATAEDLLASAEWIAAAEAEPAPAGSRPAYVFRTTFALEELPLAAELSATAHGIYEAYLNGQRVGDHELAPGLTSYRKTLYVQRYDVRDILLLGSNELRLVLSDGWFRGRSGPSRVPDNFGTRTGVIASLALTEHMETRHISTDRSWEVGVGEIIAADLMDGQTVDFRRSDRIRWQAATGYEDPLAIDRTRLAFSPAPPVRRIRQLSPTSVTRLKTGRQIVDFGQNLNGWVRLTQLGAEGTRITLSHGEALDQDGDLTMAHLAYTEYPDPEPLPTGQVDVVISRGNAADVFEPRHTTHGFRYVAVDGLDDDLAPDAITAVFVHSDLVATGDFVSSNERLNRLHEIAVASWHSNACDVPTDCPQRERWGYSGDYQIFVRSAAFLDDIEGFSRKWLRSLADDQRDDGCVTNVAPNTGIVQSPALPFSFDGSAGWGDACTIVPWQIYETYGDPAVLAETFDMMRRWVDYAAAVAATGRHDSRIARTAEPAPHERYLWDSGFHWGEWAEPDAVFDFFADKGIIATAYLVRSAEITSRSAAVLGHDHLAVSYADLAEHARDAWRTEFLGDDGRLSVESQANYVRGLAFGLIPEALRSPSTARLVELIREKDTHLSTGFLSTALLLPTLADNGELELAYELLFQRSEPSWMAMLDRGATTIWESWGGIDDDGNPHESLNHYSKGGVIRFLHEYVAGIRSDEPGYRRVTIAPRPGHDLTFARAHIDTRQGRVSSDWRMERDGRFHLSVAIPAGCSARVILPSGTHHDVGPGIHRITG